MSAQINGNPIVPGRGLTDPHVVIHEDRAVLFATHDFSPENKRFVMKDWWVWDSVDLVNWRQVGVLKPEDTFIGKPFDDCWATFGVFRNDQWYWYFSAGPYEIGVVVSDSPAGPWKDPLGKPLVPKGLVPTEQRDPDILMDEDGQAYMVFGTWDYYIVRLGGDMVSLAEKPRLVELDKKFGPYGAGRTDDKPSLHKRDGVYYLSWSGFYATSDSVYGPYVYKGSVIAPEGLAPEFCKGDIHHDRHGNFFTWNDQWYYICNDKSQPGRGEHFRDACISIVHYRDNGDMASVRLDRIGVGQYDASRPRIEATDFFKAVGVDKRESPSGGFEMRNLKDGSVLVYPNVRNLRRNPTMAFRVASVNPSGGILEIREKDPKGRLLGSCAIPATGGWEQYRTVTCALKSEADSLDVCFVCRGGSGELFRLESFRFIE